MHQPMHDTDGKWLSQSRFQCQQNISPMQYGQSASKVLVIIGVIDVGHNLTTR